MEPLEDKDKAMPDQPMIPCGTLEVLLNPMDPTTSINEAMIGAQVAPLDPGVMLLAILDGMIL